MSDDLKNAADRLVSWPVLSQLGARDVMFDPATSTVALWGQALALELHVVKPQFVPNPDYRLNTDFGQHFGIDVKVEHWPNSYRVRATRPQWFHGLSDDRDSGEYLGDFLRGLESALRDAIIHAGGEDLGDGNINVTIIPEPGFPYTPGVTKMIYSARRKKWLDVDLPPWAVKVKDRAGKERWAVDFCRLLPVICPSGGEALIGAWRSHPELNYVVTHCSPLARGGKLVDERGARLHDCPGLLFPSLATGVLPSTNFGETCFVIRPDVILPSMKPCRKRGSWETVTYNSDVWTEGSGELTGGIAIEAFDQLHGHESYDASSHLAVLGPTIKETGFADEPATRITSTARLLAALKRRFSKWTRGMTPKKFVQLSNVMDATRYGYLESKVNSVLGWGCIPLCLTPRQFAAKVEPRVRAMGFKGELLALDVPDDLVAPYVDGDKRVGLADFKRASGHDSDAMAGSDYDSWRQYQYAWIVRDAIHECARSKGGSVFFEVTEA